MRSMKLNNVLNIGFYHHYTTLYIITRSTQQSSSELSKGV